MDGRKYNKRIHVKRTTQRIFKRDVDIFITSKIKFKDQQNYCERILNSGESEIILHCVGKAIITGLNLALSLVSNSDKGLSYSINTSTIQFIDEMHPLSDDCEILFNQRPNSAVHIKISKSINTA